MKTLALCMIVKNEEELLGGCLESIKDWVDEMIVVDTGSTDNTKQIALEHGAKVFDFEWVNDFAAARNFSKAQTNCDYVIALDADERFNQKDGSRLRSAINDMTVDVGLVRLSDAKTTDSTVEEVLSIDAHERSITYLPRILRNSTDIFWTGRVHEIPNSSVSPKYLNIDIVHLGADPDYRIRKNKSERNLELLESVYADDPDQLPLFFSYLALERKAVGDNNGFFAALEVGWRKQLQFLKTKQNNITCNTGCLSSYPSTLFARGEFSEGLNALNTLIQNLTSFADNAPNTLYQVMQSCLQVNPNTAYREEFYSILNDCAVFIQEFHGETFNEPINPGVTTYKALLVQAFCLMKLGRYDEASEKLDESYTFSEGKYASDLMLVELLLEQKKLNECLSHYTELLQNNLNTSPDVWVLGAVLLIVLGQEEDARDYIRRASAVDDSSFVSPHRLNLYKGLVVRNNVLIGEPTVGVGVYGVIGAILARQPAKSTYTIPISVITTVVDAYINMNKVEALLPFFDKRAQQILPNSSQVVKARLEEAGFILEDDETESPVVLCGMEFQQMLPLFQGHPDYEVLTFSEDEKFEIEEELNQHNDAILEDLLFGSMEVFDEQEKETSKVADLIAQKMSGTSKSPVIIWDESWPVDSIEDVFDSPIPIFFLANPLAYANDSEQLREWHLKNYQMYSGLPKWRCVLNAQMLHEDPKKSYLRLMASIGAVIPDGAHQNLAVSQDWDYKTINNAFSGDADQQILKSWHLL